jgi:hypothetical protein
MTACTVMRGLSDAYGSWKTICSLRRRRRSSPPFIVVTSLPWNRTLPDVGSTSRSTERAVVDLPQPDSPTIPSVSPCRTSKLTPHTAWT